jgi:hypothetical protein
MIKELIKLAEDLDKSGHTGVADKVDEIISSLETDAQKISSQIAAKVNEMKMTEGRARRGATGFGMGSTVVVIGYSGSKDGNPGNAGDTTAKSKSAVDAAIKALGLTGKVSTTEVEQDTITGYGSVIDSDPPPSYARPASYQVDLVYLEIKE